MQKTIANTILMIRPVNVRSNEQTALNNYYQSDDAILNGDLQVKIQEEFNSLVNAIRKKGIEVLVFDINDELDTPDAHFSNNWMSFHTDGTMVLYPMYAENRRLERRPEVKDFINQKNFIINNLTDLTQSETLNRFLEGTGSMIFDRQNRILYAALSERTDQELCIKFADQFDYTPVLFSAWQTVNTSRKKIYHTNVMMCVAEQYAVICLDSIDDRMERELVETSLRSSGKEIIEITEDQVRQFAGNMIQLSNTNGDFFIVMSSSAYHSLTPEQIYKLEKHNTIIHSPLDTIEALGGGSARCMITEIFLPKN